MIDITDDTMKAIKEIQEQVIPKKERKQKKIPVYLLEEDYVKLIKKVRQTHHKIAFNLAFSSGLRISEIVRLKPEDIDFKTKRIHIRNAKGGKDRIVPLPKGFPEAYLKYFPMKCNVRAFQIAFVYYAKASGVYKEGLVFHSLRHSFAVRCMQKGIPLNVIQQILGHENISTTSIYTKLNPSEAIKSYEELW